MSVPYTLTYGASLNGSTTWVLDSSSMGGATVTFYGGTGIVNAIKIETVGGETITCGGGGNIQGSGQLATDGSLTLYEIRSVNNGPLHYISTQMSGSPATGGTTVTGDLVLQIPSGMKVRFGSITYTSSQVQQIQFSLFS